MSEIHGGGGAVGPTPREKKLYEKEYVEGASLFQKALHQAQKTESPYKREQFDEVMEKAMRVLNQTAQALKSEALQQQNEIIKKDFKAYKEHPGVQELSKLDQDLTQAKKSVG